ncbi:hypothetical protein ABFS82_08G206600 [Erythranthe guttata]
MEEKKLNFNRPFLSVRRNYSPNVTPRTSDETKTTNNNSRSAASVIPQLPSHKSELKSGPIRNPGAVPFIWEQTPGQPKQETKPKTRNSDRPPLAPKLPPGRNPKPNNPHDICNDNNVSPITNDANRRDAIVEKLERSQEREDEEEDEKESCDSETYVDALDTLSRTESFFLNCSMSGLSGLDDLDVKPSGRFSTDPQARELMMDRFLPAAKAMTLETPQYNKEAQKQNAVQEQHQQQNQIKKIVNHQHKPSLRYGPSFAKRYLHYQESEEEQEEEESDDEYDQRANAMGVCGLIPRFCLKSSFGGLLNPVPAISVRTRVPISSRNKVQPKSSSSGSYGETEIQSRSNRTEIKSIDITRAALNEEKTKSRNDSGQLETFIEEEKEMVAISEETMRKKGGGLTTFEELLADPKESNSGFPVTEKTLYVDTIRSVESPNNLTSSSLTTQDTKHVSISRKEDHDTVTKRMAQMNAIDLYLEDFNKSNTSNILSSIDKQNQSHGFSSTVTKEIQVTEKEETESFEKELSRAITVGNSYRNYSQLPIPPPLPKSPSDSWLWRTLPSISAKNSSLSSYIGATAKPQNQVVSEDCPASNMKWETIVKTTTMQRRDLHYSRVCLF